MPSKCVDLPWVQSGSVVGSDGTEREGLAMVDDVQLLTGPLTWDDFWAARQRHLSRFSRPANATQGRQTMGQINDFVAAWNSRDADAVAAQFVADGVRHQFSMPEARLAGREAIAEGVGAVLHAVPDAKLTLVSETAGSDGHVTFEWLFEGTLTNDFPGLPANGERVALPGISLCTLDPAGGIREERVYWDTATLMAAAGMLG